MPDLQLELVIEDSELILGPTHVHLTRSADFGAKSTKMVLPFFICGAYCLAVEIKSWTLVSSGGNTAAAGSSGSAPQHHLAARSPTASPPHLQIFEVPAVEQDRDCGDADWTPVHQCVL